MLFFYIYFYSRKLTGLRKEDVYSNLRIPDQFQSAKDDINIVILTGIDSTKDDNTSPGQPCLRLQFSVTWSDVSLSFYWRPGDLLHGRETLERHSVR